MTTERLFTFFINDSVGKPNNWLPQAKLVHHDINEDEDDRLKLTFDTREAIFAKSCQEALNELDTIEMRNYGSCEIFVWDILQGGTWSREDLEECAEDE